MADWTDRIVGDRMRVDQEFNDRVQASEFSSQEWGLIMTAVEFEIADADDPEAARIVANTEKLPQVMPELDNIQDQMQAMGGAGGGKSDSSGGVLDSIKSAIGLGNGAGQDKQRLAAAESLTQEYADTLQQHLESKNKWDQVRATAAES
jgi:hypothetical protein